MGEPDHPVGVRPLAREQARAAPRARRRGAERLAEQQPLVGQPLDVRRRDRMPVRLDVAAGVVGVEVEDVGCSWVHCLLIRWERLQSPYVVCATPRSGSTLLCELLAGTGVAGQPEEYFEHLWRTGLPRQPREYFDGVERRRACSTCSRRPTRAAPTAVTPFAAARSSAARRPTACSAAKLMWTHLLDRRRAARPRLRSPALLDEPAAGAALRPRHARRQGRPGRLAVARGADRARGAPATSRRRARPSTTAGDRLTSSPSSPSRTRRGEPGSQPTTSSRSPSHTRRSPTTRTPPSQRCSSTSAPGRRRSRSRRCAARATTARPAGSSAIAPSGRRWRRERLGAAAARGGVGPRHARGRGRARAPGPDVLAAARTRSSCCGWPRRRSGPARCRSRSCTSTPATTSPR